LLYLRIFRLLLKSGIADLKREIRETTAIKYYTEKKLSLGKAARLAGINRLDFIGLAGRKRDNCL